MDIYPKNTKSDNQKKKKKDAQFCKQTQNPRNLN